jgi:sugar/nucleoside kinase (ribokinase family)
MSLLVTGSIAVDTIKTPHGVSENCIGGSAVYFAMAASFFTHVRLIGVVGSDCPFDFKKVFTGRNVDLTGLEIRENSKTFRWAGTYPENMDDRKTDYMELNVLAEAPPKVPDSFRDSKYVFLESPVFVAADTMNCWITDHIRDLRRLLKIIDCLIINGDEAKMLASQFNLIKAAEKILEMGPNVVVIKKGESGAIMCDADGGKFILPAYPATDVKDPTGAGDSFAGGLMGYLAQSGKADFATLKTAVAYGTVVASFAIADFSIKRLTCVDRTDIDSRFETLRRLTSF